MTKTGTLAFAGTKCTKSSIIIPDTAAYNGCTYKVTAVADNARKDNKKVR